MKNTLQKTRIPECFHGEWEMGDSGDQWGRCMGWRFALADWMADNGEPIPDEWEFRQSPMGSDKETYEYQFLAEMVYDSETLAHIGAVLYRLGLILEAQGKDY